MDPTTKLALLLNFAATGMMIGMIWFVQIVHYPLFEAVGAERFVAYESAHGRRTTIVVAPAMLVELATSVWLVVDPPAGLPAWLFQVGLALTAILWISTFTLQVPRHTELGRGWNAAAHAALVRTNWIRTVAWSTRGMLLLYAVSTLI